MTRPLVIVGCGGFGREVFCIVEAINAAHGPVWKVEGFVDDTPSAEDCARVHALGSSVIGPVPTLSRSDGEMAVVIAIGAPAARAGVAARLRNPRLSFPPLMHPHATLGGAVTLADGIVIAAGARLSTNIRLGAHVQVDQNVTVGHDVRVGDYSRLNPQACVSGSVQIGEAVLVGANSTVLPGLRVGSGAIVGAQACVVRDVAEGATVKGVPAR